MSMKFRLAITRLSHPTGRFAATRAGLKST
jgi:hypothetical protein